MNSADGLNVPPKVSSVVPVEENCTKKGLWLTGAFLSDVERSRPSALLKVAHRRAALLFNYAINGLTRTEFTQSYLKTPPHSKHELLNLVPYQV